MPPYVRFTTKYESMPIVLATLRAMQLSLPATPRAGKNKTMSKRLFAATALSNMLAVVAWAHGMPPPAVHGGRVLEANENWLELVLDGNRVQVYVLDEERKPISATKLAGNVTVLVAGKPYKISLSVGERNEMDALLPVPANPTDAAVVALTIAGHRTSARYIRTP